MAAKARTKKAAPGKLKAARRTRSPTNTREAGDFAPIVRTAGEIVDPLRAQRVGAVWRCVQYLSGIVAQLPWRQYRPLASGGSEADEESDVSWILNRRPNLEMSAYKLRETMMRWVLLRGNAFAEIERSLDGRPRNLWPIHPNRVTLLRLASGQLIYEVYNQSGGPTYLDPRDMFHISGPSEDGLIGLPIIYYMGISVGAASAVENYGSTFFANSGVPSGYLTHPKTLDEDVSKRLENNWRRNHGGRQSQGLLVLEEGMEYKPVGVPPEQAQFLDTRRVSVEEICRWFGVPLQKVMATQQATYKNMEQFNREVIQDTVVPWLCVFEQEADYKLLSDNRAGTFTRMDTRYVLRGDSVERSTYWANLSKAGAVTINEIRESEGLPPVPGGNRRYLQVNMGPIDEDGSIMVPETPASETPSPDNEEERPQGMDGEMDRGEQANALPREIIERVASAIHDLRSGPRGPRGQRGPRGKSPSALKRRTDGKLSIVFDDGSEVTEESDATGSG